MSPGYYLSTFVYEQLMLDDVRQYYTSSAYTGPKGFHLTAP